MAEIRVNKHKPAAAVLIDKGDFKSKQPRRECQRVAQHFASVCMEPQQCWHLLALVAYSLKPVKL